LFKILEGDLLVSIALPDQISGQEHRDPWPCSPNLAVRRPAMTLSAFARTSEKYLGHQALTDLSQRGS